ncbi:hypothetical protein LA080_004921 [Diaporthe eres]|nr:hypothetical protein LA080_004921 [Diaporthe eres]
MVLSFLPVQGALLAYQCLGTGPILLTIPGANGDAAIFNEVAPYLAQDFTVCTYDRRGYSNSTLTGNATAEDLAMPYRLQRDADDAAALLSHVSGGDPGLVFGTRLLRETCNIPSCNISAILASEVGVDLYVTPGGHLGYVSDPEGFAEMVLSIFAAHGKA